MLMCSRRRPTRRAIHKIATSQITAMVWRINVLFISASVCILLQSVLQFFQRQAFQCVHPGERLLRALRTNTKLRTARLLSRDCCCFSGGDDLRLECTILHLSPEPHPGADLWQRGGQDEQVERVVLARCPKLYLEAPPVQHVHTSLW